jgi:excisionase family DNA binding protein
MDELLTTSKLSKYLDLTPVTIRRKAQTEEIPSIKIGNRLQFDRQQVDTWLMENSNRGAAQILVVDDEPTVGDLIKNTFEMGRYQVTTILSSLEALQIIKQKRFDLIFLDLLMPEIDGSELFKHIREIDKDVPVVIVTGYPHSDIMEKAMEYGPFTVIKKSFMINDVLGVVRSIAGG